MKMKKALSRGTILALFAILSLSAMAKSINEQTARQKAESFMRKQLGFPMGMRMQRVETMLPTTVLPTRSATTGEANQPIYIFNCEGGGYVIVSGDDRTFEILGYSCTGHIDPATIPSNMKSWLCTYAEAINNLGNIDVPVHRTPTRAKKEIKPCLITTWGQDEPYNRYTPCYTYTHNGETYSEPSATGCVATAMAQVMYYYRYPNAVQADLPGYNGTHEVKTEDGKTVTATYTVEPVAAGTPIDWDNMVSSYGNNASYTDANVDAVAHLMQYLGTAFMADYGPETSVFTSDQLEGTFKAFGYKDVYFVYDDSYDTYEEWADRVYEELEDAEVLAFGGRSQYFGGHTFVLDGYEGEDYFHVNWGWNGDLDGYYKLSVMDPYFNMEIFGFNTIQHFMAGLGPNGKGYTTMEPAYECRSLSLGEIGEIYEPFLDFVYLLDYKMEFGNASFTTLNAWAGLGMYDEEGNLMEKKVLGSEMLTTEHRAFYEGSGSFFVWDFDIEEGKIYTIKPIFSTIQTEDGKEPEDGDWKPMYKADKNMVYFTIKTQNAGTGKVLEIIDDISGPKAVQHTDGVWWTLDGHMLPEKPTTRGIYIKDGKKVLIK